MRRFNFRYLAVATLAATALAACGSSAKSTAPPTTSPATTTASSSAPPTSGSTPATVTVATASTKLGSVLVDGKGLTLYTFSGDTAPGTSTCTGQCATVWPPLTVTGSPTYAAGLTASKFTTISRADGTKQLAYNGKPLYTFQSDSAPGDTSGQGVGGFSVAMR